ncbi:unnamed protein product [Hymenolepis diminuta]|uniref:SAGA-associated factor 11 n=1 Tax=Hymenolepis diminuta TaxID=6216 RepID=A0A0R3STC4_HYMDI|nr:unnamed protein product [Hymenolepis diminuta]VUZ42544.1 unnamed protein product [Hymenolepis diminuta]
MNVNDKAIQSIVEELIDSCVMDDILSIHRSIKLDYSHLLLADPKDVVNGVNESTSLSSFQKTDSGARSSTVFVHCARCTSKVAATRYASHLSNCMGLGRNSSRRANRLIAEQRRFEDSDDVEDAYYLENSPMSFSGHKTESSLNSFSKTASYPSRSLKSNLRLAGIASKSSNGRGCNTIPGDSVFEKADSYESVTFSCGDDDESNSSEAPRRSGSSRNRRHQKTHL